MKNYLRLDKVISGLRKEYHFGKLEDGRVSKDPFLQFVRWFEEALAQKVNSINAMALATCARGGKPSVRVLLVKGFDRKGFIFFSHYDSAKAREIKSNPHGEMLFYWPEIEKQIRIKGKIVRIPQKVTEAYFIHRPRASKIAAWVSHQSRVVESRSRLEKQYVEWTNSFEGKDVPLPDFWGGYRLEPELYEFWQGRENRLNDRIVYKRSGKRGWSVKRLQP